MASGGLTVVGGRHPTIAPLLTGRYVAHGSNHGQVMYKRCKTSAASFDVFCYYWDARDGEDFRGWWFAPEVGGQQVWAYNPSAATSPPKSGWQVPSGGAVDASFLVAVSAAVTSTATSPGAGAQKRPVGTTAGPSVQQLISIQPQLRQILQRLRAASPETLEGLLEEVRRVVDSEAPKFGPQERAARDEMAKYVMQARARVDVMKARQQESESLSGDAPQAVDVPASAAALLWGRGGSTLKRLMDVTACTIHAPEALSSSFGDSDEGPVVALRLSGGAKQRRLAADAVIDIVSGADLEDVDARAQGAVAIIPHQLVEDTSQKWLQWRLSRLEPVCDAQLEVSRRAVRVWSRAQLLGKEGQGSELNSWDDAAQAAVDGAVVEAQQLYSQTIELERGGGESVDAGLIEPPSESEILAALQVWVDQYGLGITVKQGPAAGVSLVGMTGPRTIVQDAAALLWAKFKQRKDTAVVLLAGCLAHMDSMMASEFRKDLEALLQEYRVEVNESSDSIWLSGENSESVAAAQKTLCEMLQFYLPGSFYLRECTPTMVQNLRAHADLCRLRAAVSDVAMVFDEDAGLVWLCGASGPFGEAQQMIHELLPVEAKG